ncbi:MAG: NAD-dependent epimerase/dehydratase family protein [Nitrososphaerota archaeon]
MVTGSEGFIGRNLVKRISRNDRVYTLDRKPSNSRFASVHYVGDIADKETFNQIDVPLDIIYHFGSASSILSFKGRESELSNLELKGFVNILEFAKERGVKKFIYPSTASVYSREQISGKKILNPINIYGAVKFAEEQICTFYAGEMTTIGLRIFMAYGPGEEIKGERASPISLFCKDVFEKKSPVIYGDGRQIRDPLYIEDLVEVLYNVKDSCLNSGVYDICTGNPVTFNEIIGAIRVVTGNLQFKVTYIPKPNSYVEGVTCDPTLTKELLGRDFTSLHNGIKRIFEHLSSIQENEEDTL